MVSVRIVLIVGRWGVKMENNIYGVLRKVVLLRIQICKVALFTNQHP